MNNNLILIGGKSSTGKSASLRNIPNPEGVLYLNCDNGKELPFPSKFKCVTILDPKKVPEMIGAANDIKQIHTIIIDTVTFLMDMFESQYIIGSDNPQQGWGEYQQFFKLMMQKEVANSPHNIIFTAHTADTYNQKELATDTLVKVKGALMTRGIEAFFNTVTYTKVLAISELEGYSSPLLNISEEERKLGYKYVYQTRKTADTSRERIRASMGMWKPEETFIDNDIQLLLDRSHQYYS